MQLKEELTLIQCGNQSILDYLYKIAIIDHPTLADDLTLYVLNGLGLEFWEIVAPI